jgi:hypothetical protein
MPQWTVKLSDGSDITDSTTNSSWRKLAENLVATGRKIVSLTIHNDYGSGRIDDNKDGYFISNKLVTRLAGPNIELVGIGYYRKSDNMARIKWYNCSTMDLVTTEARPPEECGLSLIINPE